MADYDLLVIGAGPAGEKAAAQAAYFGKKVALVDRNFELGGTVAKTALPLKGMRETALYVKGFRQRSLHGVEFKVAEDLSVDGFLRRGREVGRIMSESTRFNMQRHGVDCIQAEAAFADRDRILLSGAQGVRVVSPKIVFLAPGSLPFRPPPFDIDHPALWDSDTVLSMSKFPDSMLVVGGGAVGCEYACIFAALGSKVTLVQSEYEILPFADRDISRVLRRAMREAKIEIITNDRVVGREPVESGFRWTTSAGRTLDAEVTLCAIGRRCSLGSLRLDNAGVELTDRSFIKVDDDFRTTNPKIFAGGDAIGGMGLSSLAMEQGRLAIINALQLDEKARVAKVVPTGIWTIPEVAMVGETEDQLRKRGASYVIGTAMYRTNPRGIIIGEDLGQLKCLFDRENRRLLGAHCLGEESCEVIATATT
ncbi:MAG: FAD-dependent oxidoreductase, partial [Acidobacteriota bacterium]